MKAVLNAFFSASLLSLGVLTIAGVALPTKSSAGFGMGCGTSCMMKLNGFCPTCRPMMYSQYSMPWDSLPPWWWATGPLSYSNFYSPGPWGYTSTYNSFAPYGCNSFGSYCNSNVAAFSSPGIIPNYYPGSGGGFAAKPNLYIEGPVGTEVKVKLNFGEATSNWLASVPAHGASGWKVTLAERNKLKAGDATYGYLYSDYRMDVQPLQDQAGFCTGRKDVIAKMALQLKADSFSPREIADFIEYWSVKLPQSKSFCVYPQDERQLNVVAPLDITPKPAYVRRVLFMVQVEEGLKEGLKKESGGHKFTAAPTKPWSPEPIRMPADSDKNAIVAREWGVGFFAAH